MELATTGRATSPPPGLGEIINTTNQPDTNNKEVNNENNNTKKAIDYNINVEIYNENNDGSNNNSNNSDNSKVAHITSPIINSNTSSAPITAEISLTDIHQSILITDTDNINNDDDQLMELQEEVNIEQMGEKEKKKNKKRKSSKAGGRKNPCGKTTHIRKTRESNKALKEASHALNNDTEKVNNKLKVIHLSEKERKAVQKDDGIEMLDDDSIDSYSDGEGRTTTGVPGGYTFKIYKEDADDFYLYREEDEANEEDGEDSEEEDSEEEDSEEEEEQELLRKSKALLEKQQKEVTELLDPGPNNSNV